jgi:glycosyltransferase involved in cell wall biosynthesis
VSTKRALVCALMPQFDRDSGSRRVFDLIAFLQEAGWAVSFVADHTKNDERYARTLQQRGVAVYAGSKIWIEQLVALNRFDLAVFGLWHIAEPYLPIIRRTSPETRIIVDSIDLHFLRNARRIFREPNGNGSLGKLDSAYADEMIREANTYAAADGVLAVSQKEADLINDFVGDPTLACTLPLSSGSTPSSIPFAERRGILFVGFFRFSPNISAVEYLCKEILPRLDPALLDEHPVYIVGDGLDETVRSFGRHLPQVRMVGWVPSLLPYLQRARITVVPLLYGAGTKGKLIQALIVGTPSVSTTVGIEGLDLRDGEHVLVADDPVAFASAMARLLRDEALWQRLARQGRDYIAAVHGREAVREKLLKIISTVFSRDPKPALAVK